MLDSAERRVREPIRTSGSRADFWYRMSGTENTSSWSVRGEGGARGGGTWQGTGPQGVADRRGGGDWACAEASVPVVAESGSSEEICMLCVAVLGTLNPDAQ